MKKIILAILIALGALVIFSISCSICSSCVSCMSCDSCGSCGSCDNGGSSGGGSSSGGGGGGYTPPTYYSCTIMRNYDGGDNVTYTFNTSEYSLNSSLITREGYDFLGVYDDPEGGNMYFDAQGSYLHGINENNKTLYMHWQVKTYTVEMYVEGRLDSTVESVEYGTDITYVLDTPESPDYGQVFKGWAIKTPDTVYVTNGDLEPLQGYETVGSAFMPDGNNVIRLYAVFGEPTCTVTLVYNDGRADEVREIRPGNPITDLPELSDSGNKKFMGWALENSLSTTNFYLGEPIYEDTKLYAIFLEYKTIQVKTRDGSVIGSITVYNNGQAVDLNNWQTNDDISIQEGYQILGWYTNQNLTGSSKITSIRYGSRYTEVYVDYTLT